MYIGVATNILMNRLRERRKLDEREGGAYPGMVGQIDRSTTRRLLTPRTLKLPSRTALSVGRGERFRERPLGNCHRRLTIIVRAHLSRAASMIYTSPTQSATLPSSSRTLLTTPLVLRNKIVIFVISLNCWSRPVRRSDVLVEEIGRVGPACSFLHSIFNDRAVFETLGGLEFVLVDFENVLDAWTGTTSMSG